MKQEQDYYLMPAVGDCSKSDSSSRSELSLETELRLGVGPPPDPPSSAKADSKGKQQIAQQNASIVTVNPQVSLSKEGLIPQGYPAFLLGGMLESAAAPVSSSSKYQTSSSTYEHYYKNGTSLPIKRGYSEANPSSQLQSSSGENKHSTCSWSNSTATLVQSFGQSSTSPHQNDNRNQAGTTSPSRGAPVVGWPPVRSFRKSTIAAAATTVSVAVPQKHAEKVEEVAPLSVTAVIPKPTVQNPTSQTLFVKANVDGVPIGRKIDLKAFSSYEGLKTALEEMFQPFMKAERINLMGEESQRPQFKFLHGQDYVLTHQDKDGDWLFVGDVPWGMFISTVKRLRVMKTTDATGLGRKPADPALKILPSTSKSIATP